MTGRRYALYSSLMKYKKKIKMKFKDIIPVPKLVPVTPARDSKGRFVSKKKVEV